MTNNESKLRSDLVFLGGIAVLFVTGVLDAKEAFSGFSSTSVVGAVVRLMLPVAALSSFLSNTTVVALFCLGVGVLMNIIILAANIFIVNVVYPLTPLP